MINCLVRLLKSFEEHCTPVVRWFVPIQEEEIDAG